MSRVDGIYNKMYIVLQDDGRIPLVNIPMSLLRPKPDSLEGHSVAVCEELEKIHGPLDPDLLQAHVSS